jgi:beta-hydroxylase
MTRAASTLNPPTTLIGKLAQRFIEWAEDRIGHASLVGDQPWFERAQFPWVEAVEREWPAIRGELERVLVRRDELPAFHEITREVETITRDQHWKTFMFCGYGFRCEENLKRCPETARVLASIPGLETAFFSILSPGKYVPPHRGPYNGVLRLHLGLVIPEPRERCWIRVADQTRTWEEGKALLFDDSYEHEVHNDTDGLRVVLFVDFRRPCRGFADWLNRLILKSAVLVPFVREAADNGRKWEKKFYANAPPPATDVAVAPEPARRATLSDPHQEVAR